MFGHLLYPASSQVHLEYSGSKATKYVILLTHNCNFNEPEKESFCYDCGKKEQMLVTSIFSFSHNVFHPSENKFQV